MTTLSPTSERAAVTDVNPAAADNHAVRGGRLGWGMLSLYGIGGLSDNVPTFGLNHLLLFYLTIICGLPGAAAGLVVGLGLVFDGVLEPLIGSLSDNSHSRHGRRHPFMILGAIPLALAFGLLFSIPAGVSQSLLFVGTAVMVLLVWGGYAVFNVPYTALGAELTDDYHERSLVVAARLFFGQLAAALATFLAYGVFLKGANGLTHREAYAPFAWCCAAIVIVGGGLCIAGTLGARNRLHAASPTQRFGFLRFFAEFGELFRNPSLRVMFTTAFVFMIAMGLNSVLGLHANKYFWKLTTSQILAVNEMSVFGAVGGIVTAAALGRLMQKRTLVIFGMGLVAVCQLSLVPLKLAGLLPHDIVFAAVTIAGLLTSAGATINFVGFQSMMADAADQHEHMFGSRREGLCYSCTALASKVAMGLGAMVAGVTLDFIGFPRGISKAANLVIPSGTLRDLGLTYGPGVGLLCVVAVVLILSYRLDQNEHSAIRDALAHKRNQPQAG